MVEAKRNRGDYLDQSHTSKSKQFQSGLATIGRIDQSPGCSFLRERTRGNTLRLADNKGSVGDRPFSLTEIGLINGILPINYPPTHHVQVFGVTAHIMGERVWKVDESNQSQSRLSLSILRSRKVLVSIWSK